MSFRPGQRISGRDFIELADRAAVAGVARFGAGLVGSSGPGGISVAVDFGAMARRVYRGETLRAEHQSQSVAPLWGVGEIYSGVGGADYQPVVYVRRPFWPGTSRIGIYLEGACKGDCPTLMVRGCVPVLYDRKSLPPKRSLCPGDRLGPSHHSYYAQWDRAGALRVVGDLAPQNDDVGLALVELIGRRGDTVLTVGEGGNVHAVAYTWVFGSGFTISEPRPGVVLVEASS